MKHSTVAFPLAMNIWRTAMPMFLLALCYVLDIQLNLEDYCELALVLATQNMSDRRTLLKRLKEEVAALEEAVTVAGQHGDVRGARPPVLDSVVDVDYFLRKLALSFGITTEDRRRVTEEKARARKH